MATVFAELLDHLFSATALFGVQPASTDAGVSQSRIPGAELLAGRVMKIRRIMEHSLLRQGRGAEKEGILWGTRGM